jgi:hypothetical protein
MCCNYKAKTWYRIQLSAAMVRELNSMLFMSPLTLRQNGLAKLDRIRLSEEIIEIILNEFLADVIHEAFDFAINWTLDSTTEPLLVYRLIPVL